MELNEGVSWKLVCTLVHMAYANSSPPKLVARISKPPLVAAPGVKMKPADIDRIDVSTGEMQMRMLRNSRPTTAFEAKFSMEFALASAVAARGVGLSQLTDAFVARGDVQDLIRRVFITTTTETLDGSAFAASETESGRRRGGHRYRRIVAGGIWPPSAN